MNIDHHTTGKRFAQVECIIPEACATAEILYDLFRFAGEPLDRTLAECLYAGIIGDTGNFRFSNTTARSHEIAAELIRAGVQPHEAYEHVYGSSTAGQMKTAGNGAQHPSAIRSRANCNHSGDPRDVPSNRDYLRGCGRI
ncbi:MAG: hypothetical protein KatS3mg115_2637 [Candidatus Poribacteria bacterium]|nr:MAG: hypothetical protein KatS3mg115_2637 [Candidatus Poribacteria bacterium]